MKQPSIANATTPKISVMKYPYIFRSSNMKVKLKRSSRLYFEEIELLKWNDVNTSSHIRYSNRVGKRMQIPMSKSEATFYGYENYKNNQLSLKKRTNIKRFSNKITEKFEKQSLRTFRVFQSQMSDPKSILTMTKFQANL